MNIDALVDPHGELLVEGLADAIGGGRTAGLVHACQAQVPGNQTLISYDLAGHADRGTIQFLKPVLKAYRGQFVAAGAERDRLQHLGTGFAKLDMQFAQSVGIRQGHFQRERPRAHPSRFSSSSK